MPVLGLGSTGYGWLKAAVTPKATNFQLVKVETQAGPASDAGGTAGIRDEDVGRVLEKLNNWSALLAGIGVARRHAT